MDSSADDRITAATSGADVAEPLASGRTRQIVDAACELLDELGLEGLTIRAVLNRTGLSRRAFYERFVGKDDLVLAAFAQVVRGAVFEFERQARLLADPLKRLELVICSIVIGRASSDMAGVAAGNRRGAALSREHLRLAESRPEELQRAIRPLVDLLAEYLADGMRAGVVRASEPQRLAALTYNLVSTTVHMELITESASRQDEERRQHLAEEIWDFCRRAITA